MLAAGVRYRFANGLRAAMRIWGLVLVAVVVAVGLEAAPPFVRWGHAWMALPFPRRVVADVIVGLSLGVLARGAFLASVGGWGAEQLIVLPLTRAQRFAIDYASVLLYLSPPLVAMIAICASGEPLASVLLAATIGASGGRAPRLSGRPAINKSRGQASAPYEWRWLLRATGDRVPIAVATSTLAAAASIFAIRNNDVVAPLAILRIESLFLAFAAGLLASAILGSRDAARPFRVTESVLPISAAERLRTLLATSMPLMLVPLAVVALLRFSLGALAYGAASFALVLLIGEAASLRGVRGESHAMLSALVATIAGALDGRVALVIAIVLLPFAWRRALVADAANDLRVVRMETA